MSNSSLKLGSNYYVTWGVTTKGARIIESGNHEELLIETVDFPVKRGLCTVIFRKRINGGIHG